MALATAQNGAYGKTRAILRYFCGQSLAASHLSFKGIGNFTTFHTPMRKRDRFRAELQRQSSRLTQKSAERPGAVARRHFCRHGERVGIDPQNFI
jgi:hypothetical protein